MAKESGLGANFYLGGYNLSGDTGSMSGISKGLTPLPVTGIGKSAVERLPGKLNGRIAWSSWWNPSNAHLALRTLPRSDRVASYWHRTALGAPVASCVGKQINYNPTRGNDGSLSAAVEVLSNAWWLDWGLGLTAGIRIDGAATNGASVDYGAGFAFGLQAYLHVFAFTGTSVTIKLQQSADNGVGDPWADVTGGAFAVVTGANVAERIQTSRTQAVERYLRAVTTGVFSNVQFAVSATVNQTENLL
jgi:hypothetical protein